MLNIIPVAFSHTNTSSAINVLEKCFHHSFICIYHCEVNQKQILH